VADGFPIGLTLGPPVGSKTPAGRDGLDEVATAGVDFVRTGLQDWSGEFLDGQIQQQRTLHAAVADRGLKTWLWLGDLPDLPGPKGTNNQTLLTRVVNAFKNDGSLLAWKGYDEPRNRFRGDRWIRPAGLVRAHDRIRQLDPNHPLVIVHAPGSTAAQLTPYRPAAEILGVDIYPVSYPPGVHVDGRVHDLSIVGDVVRTLRTAAGPKPFWVTLQVAWSGITPSADRPDVVPRFPTLAQERFMAYQAIVNGARGLVFFGGHIRTVMTAEDAQSGWNWTFWRRVLRPTVSELSSPDIRPALTAPNASTRIAPSPADAQIELVTRRTSTHLYVIAVRKGGAVKRVSFGGLPRGIARGEVLSEYVNQAPRRVAVANGTFRDWFAAYDAHVYRFAL
jgi:hypothetical protein